MNSLLPQAVRRRHQDSLTEPVLIYFYSQHRNASCTPVSQQCEGHNANQITVFSIGYAFNVGPHFFAWN